MTVNDHYRIIMDRKSYKFSGFYNAYAELMRHGEILTAKKLAENYLVDFDDPNVWAIYGRILLCLGESLSARAIFRNCYRKCLLPHISDIIHARVNSTIAIVDENVNVLYIPIPKCGSTTVKSYFSRALFEEKSGLAAHDKLVGMHKIIDFDDLTTTYADYYKFTVIRPAEERIISYYNGNIRNGYLRKNSFESGTFMNLSTKPTFEVFMQKFYEYRQKFLDVRHHTDPINGYLPSLEMIDAVYTMSELEKIRSLLQDIYKIKLEPVLEMTSKNHGDKLDIQRQIEDFYDQEAKFFQ